VQLTPPGSGCSLQIGKGLTDALAGSLRNIYLVVTDLEAARSHLLERGVEVSAIRHKVPLDAWDGGFAPGLDSAHRDYASFADFSDPDGNRWVLQERGYRMNFIRSGSKPKQCEADPTHDKHRTGTRDNTSHCGNNFDG
jgi:hypothetical protein